MSNFSNFQKKCPECGDALKTANSCRCGWKNNFSENKVFECQFAEGHFPCRSVVGVRLVSKPPNAPTYWCFKHYEAHRSRHDYQFEMEKQWTNFSPKKIINPAPAPKTEEKQAQSIRNILLKQNHPYAVMQENK